MRTSREDPLHVAPGEDDLHLQPTSPLIDADAGVDVGLPDAGPAPDIGAREKTLNDVRAKADGYFGGNPQDDWITTQEERQRLGEKTSELLTAIDAELETLGAL